MFQINKKEFVLKGFLSVLSLFFFLRGGSQNSKFSQISEGGGHQYSDFSHIKENPKHPGGGRGGQEKY